MDEFVTAKGVTYKFERTDDGSCDGCEMCTDHCGTIGNCDGGVYKIVDSLPVTTMVEFDGKLYVAIDRGVYVLEDDVFVPVKWATNVSS